MKGVFLVFALLAMFSARAMNSGENNQTAGSENKDSILLADSDSEDDESVPDESEVTQENPEGSSEEAESLPPSAPPQSPPSGGGW